MIGDIKKGNLNMKIAESLGAVYIVKFNQIKMIKHRSEAMLFRRI